MPFVSKEQIAKAREMDLLTYLLRYEPEELVHFGGNTYTTRTHDSLKISNGRWCWWSRGIGGTNALDYLVAVRGLSLPDAVMQILRPSNNQIYSDFAILFGDKPTPFLLPPRHTDDKRVFAYLTSRGIAPEIINHCIKHGQLYEDAARHNCVFVGYEDNTPRYGGLRGTNSDTTFMGEVPGSDKRFSFAVPLKAGSNETLCVFESAIDLLSYLTLIKLNGHNWRDANCLSLAGIYPPRKKREIKFPVALDQYLHDNPHIERVILCLDNDRPGRLASQAIHDRLEPTYSVIDNPPRKGKDYNDFLRKKIGITSVVKTRGNAR